ncbi:MAG: Asp-tRNA(Asn)/Glu-tRNA(Gln) amidotransferase subunit GatB [Ferrimicrobium sp.]
MSDAPGIGWEWVIGLEVHTELRTATKLFCGCANDFGKEPNTSVCPVCLGLPGTLPVLNEEAITIAARVGAALGSRVQSSQFHRKNYFYPDMPKNYQISQYDVPINAGGSVPLPNGTVIGVVRAHLEEDTGKLIHKGGGGRIGDSNYSVVDYNRSGVPLLEVVSEPDLRSPGDARSYVLELRALLVAVGASDGRMEEGSLRVDANVSVRPVGAEDLRTRCEIKNLNSLRSVVRAITYEGERQVALYLAGDRVVQETRHWDESKGVTSSLRLKEEANDYRYFPEPDLPPLVIEETWAAEIARTLPDLPRARRARLRELLGDVGHEDQISTAIQPELWPFVLAGLVAGVEGRLVVARAVNELAGLLETAGSLTPQRFVAVCQLESARTLGASQAKILLRGAHESDRSIEELVAELGLGPDNQEELAVTVDAVIATYPAEWDRYCGGDDRVGGFLLGKVMRTVGSRVSGQAARQLLDERVAARNG